MMTMIRSVMKSRALRALLLSAALAPAVAAAETPGVPGDQAPSFDGIYFLSASEGEARLLDLRGKSAGIIHDGDGPPERATIHGLYYVSGNDLAVRYFNGEGVVTAQCTAALVDGHLWVGVMGKRRSADERPADGQSERPGELWISGCYQSGLFAAPGHPMPRGEVWWDLARDEWHFSPAPRVGDWYPAHLVRHVVPLPLPAVDPSGPSGPSPESRPAREGTEREAKAGELPARFVPYFPRDGASVAEVDRFRGVWRGKGEVFDVHVGGPELEEDLGILGSSVGRDADAHAAAPATPRADAEAVLARVADRKPRPTFYQRHGNVVLAPWSVDIGPAGLVPVKLEAGAAAGEWVCEEDPHEGLTVSPAAPEPAGRGAGQGARDVLQGLGPPGPEQVKGAVSHIVYQPDDAGICHKRLYWNCGMNHGDFAGHVYWFPLSARRSARFIYPATHMGGSAVGHVQFFTRKL